MNRREINQRELILGGLVVLVVVLLLALGLSTVHRGLKADREGCERVNVLRVNQARLLGDQIAASERSLSRSLGPLEAFRDEAEEALRVRKAALGRLRASAKDHPVKGQPYKIDCEAAYR